MNLTPAARRAWYAGLFMLSTIATGTIGYLFLGLSFLDAVYQSTITVTTVGFEEIHTGDEPTDAYRLFTLLLMLLGVGSVLFAAGVLMESILEARLDFRGERKMEKRISELSGHLIVCGHGRVGRAVTARAFDLGESVVVVERRQPDDDETVPWVVGDATESAILEKAGIERATALVAALPTDEANLFLAVGARQDNPNLRIVCRVNEPGSKSKLAAIGIDEVIEPYEIAGSRLATAALRPHTADYVEQIFSRENDAIEVAEMTVAKGCHLDARSITEVNEVTGAVLVAVKQPGARSFRNVRGADRIQHRDVVIALGDPDSIIELRLGLST